MINAPTPGFGEVVTVLRPGAPVRDVYGNDVHGPDEEHPVPGCSIAPRSGSETVGGRDTVVEHLVIFAPPAADVRPTDRLRIRGLTYTVHGPVEVYRSPLTGTTAGVQITARRITG
ncbi:hypothetical protein LE181_02010 [Streptomyces sp. SCA3-4]|uniref:hypothetical protein n=1 Tax=Streptomyces sichuanensis TaxID=2871810 RepID=UPI001CE374B0|nr:hypothetical protein [Streptomyces sichuanensis]MCA6090949.1 hypothetical protein [Streptomyces sichuanensis]